MNLRAPAAGERDRVPSQGSGESLKR
jgi:hypothetical protein